MWKWKSESENHSVVFNSFQLHGLYSPWDSPGQNIGVSNLSFLQGIFPTQGSNPGPPHCRWFLYQLSHKWSLRILEWVACPFSSGSSQPRNQTIVSCIAGGFFLSTELWENISIIWTKLKNATRVLKTIHRTKSRRVQHVNEKLTIVLVVKSLKVKIVTYGYMSVSLK